MIATVYHRVNSEEIDLTHSSYIEVINGDTCIDILEGENGEIVIQTSGLRGMRMVIVPESANVIRIKEVERDD